MTLDEWAEWLTAGTWDMPALETRDEFKAGVLQVLRDHERETVQKAAKAVCLQCFNPHESCEREAERRLHWAEDDAEKMRDFLRRVDREIGRLAR